MRKLSQRAFPRDSRTLYSISRMTPAPSCLAPLDTMRCPVLFNVERYDPSASALCEDHLAPGCISFFPRAVGLILTGKDQCPYCIESIASRTIQGTSQVMAKYLILTIDNAGLLHVQDPRTMCILED